MNLAAFCLYMIIKFQKNNNIDRVLVNEFIYINVVQMAEYLI